MNSARVNWAIDEPPVAPRRHLPGMGLSLARFAARFARHARPLLLTNNALLLTMTADTQDASAPLWTGFWNTRCTLAPLPPMIDNRASQRHFAALEAAAAIVLADVMCRWPTNAIPPAMGIFTDGGGVAFSSDHPSPRSSDWLAHHQAGLCPTTTLLPFRPDGAWSRLIAPNVDLLVH